MYIYTYILSIISLWIFPRHIPNYTTEMCVYNININLGTYYNMQFQIPS